MADTQSLGALSPAEVAAVTLIRRRPKLAEVLAAIHAMTERHRNCRVLVEVRDGRIVTSWFSPTKTFELDAG